MLKMYMTQLTDYSIRILPLEAATPTY